MQSTHTPNSGNTLGWLNAFMTADSETKSFMAFKVATINRNLYYRLKTMLYYMSRIYKPHAALATIHKICSKFGF